MLLRKNSANISIFSVMVVVRILFFFCETLVLCNLSYFSIPPMFTSSKWNILFLLYFWIARMVGWVLCFNMALKTGSLMFSVTKLLASNLEFQASLWYLKRNYSKSPLFQISKVNVFTFSVQFIFSVNTVLSES